MSCWDFPRVLDQLEALHNRKSADYGNASDPFLNVNAARHFGVKPWVAALVRANDKMVRLSQAAQGSELVNESVEDSLLDLASYAIIALILFREEEYATHAERSVE